MTVPTPHNSPDAIANSQSAEKSSGPAREQWVSLAIAAATASLRASAPGSDEAVCTDQPDEV